MLLTEGFRGFKKQADGWAEEWAEGGAGGRGRREGVRV